MTIPERVWLVTAGTDEWPIPVHYWTELEPKNLKVGRGTPYVLESRLHEAEAKLTDLEDTLDTYWVNNVNKLRAEHKALLSVLEHSEEYLVCLDDSTAMAYDGATTRTVWRQSVEKARAILNA